jgi:TolA-binding protein
MPRFTVVAVWSGPILAHAVFEPDSVRVIAGQVSLLSPEGKSLATLAAGDSFRPAAQTAEPPRRTPERPVAAVPKPSVAAILEAARAALARGDTGEARRQLKRALAAGPQRRERADAELFEAESYLMDHDIDRATEAYRAVAAAFAPMPEGEEAAFGLAQVLYEHGRSEEADRALRAYLAGYPAGRFTREAEDHLASLRAAR